MEIRETVGTDKGTQGMTVERNDDRAWEMSAETGREGEDPLIVIRKELSAR